MSAIICNNIGVNGSRIYWMTRNDKKEFWCRSPIAIFGRFNTTPEYRKKTSPFDPEYRDNYVEGRGSTKDIALAKMNEELKNISESLWY